MKIDKNIVQDTMFSDLFPFWTLTISIAIDWITREGSENKLPGSETSSCQQQIDLRRHLETVKERYKRLHQQIVRQPRQEKQTQYLPHYQFQRQQRDLN